MNNLNKKEVANYMVTINNFEKSELNSNSRYQEFLIVMAVPSIVFFSIAAFIMGIIMKRNFNKI